MSASRQQAIILPFVRPPREVNRLSFRDRIDIMEWHASEAAQGYTRLAIDTEHAGHNPELGDYVLVYRPEDQWASWGVGCCDGGYMVWHPQSLSTRGWHASIRAALASLPAPE